MTMSHAENALYYFVHSNSPPMTRHRLYHPQTAQISADIIRVDTCDTRRYMPTPAPPTGHRAVVPAGAGINA